MSALGKAEMCALRVSAGMEGGTSAMSCAWQFIDALAYADGHIELMRGQERLPFRRFDPLQQAPEPDMFA